MCHKQYKVKNATCSILQHTFRICGEQQEVQRPDAVFIAIVVVELSISFVTDPVVQHPAAAIHDDLRRFVYAFGRRQRLLPERCSSRRRRKCWWRGQWISWLLGRFFRSAWALPALSQSRGLQRHPKSTQNCCSMHDAAIDCQPTTGESARVSFRRNSRRARCSCSTMMFAASATAAARATHSCGSSVSVGRLTSGDWHFVAAAAAPLASPFRFCLRRRFADL